MCYSNFVHKTRRFQLFDFKNLGQRSLKVIRTDTDPPFMTSYYAALLPRRGPHIASHSVCLSVRPSRYWMKFFLFYSRTVLRANIKNRKTSVFAYGPASRMYFSACAEGRISYGHLGRTNSCLFNRDLILCFNISG